MKNLENYGVQELNAKEIRETDGGWLWLALGVGAVIGLIAGLWDKTDSCQ